MFARAGLPWVMVVAASLPVTAGAQGVPYNPYADSQDQPAPVAADGTIRWGVFYKSAAMQETYERLWNMGACRGTSKAIVIPVTENKLNVDDLPEAEFTGIVRAAEGTLGGGMIAFDESSVGSPDAALLVAQLHPAGVSRLVVVGESTASILRPGMMVRLSTAVNAHGQATEPVKAIEIFTPARDFKPSPVVAGEAETVEAVLTQVHRNLMDLRVDAGRIRKLHLRLASDATVTIDASSLDLVSAGDRIELKGRLWTGEGSMGAGTVFASDVLVRKAAPAAIEDRRLPAAAIEAR